MDKVYQGCMLVDESELDILLDAVGSCIDAVTYCDEPFNELVKLYVKLLKEKESIERERAKYELKTESI